MNYLKHAIRFFFLSISLISGGFIYYEQITIGFGIISIYLAVPCFIISSLITVLIETESNLKCIHGKFGGFFLWLTSTIVLFCTMAILNKIRNISPVLFETNFYWEEGIDVQFRKNGTFKALNSHLLGGDVTYGKYKLVDSLIILKDNLKFGNENISDTLKISETGVLFTMEKPWRISEGKMWFKYLTKTEIDIINNTEKIIDSISIKPSFTNESVNTVSIRPKQKIRYIFEIKNSHVNGEYILNCKIMDRSNELKEIRNFLNGYPMETVEFIRFDHECLSIKLIFGNTIKIFY